MLPLGNTSSTFVIFTNHESSLIPHFAIPPSLLIVTENAMVGFKHNRLFVILFHRLRVNISIFKSALINSSPLLAFQGHGFCEKAHQPKKGHTGKTSGVKV